MITRETQERTHILSIYVAAVGCVIFMFSLPILFMGYQPYNTRFLLWSFLGPVLLLGGMAALTYDTLSWRQVRFGALSIGAGWLLGVAPPSDNSPQAIGLLWQPLWNSSLRLLTNSGGLYPVELLLLALTIIAFLGMCWGVGGMFRKFTTRKDPFLTRGTSKGGAKIQRARWATPSEAAQSLNAPGGIVLGEMTPVEIGGFNAFKPDDPYTWGRQGKGPLLTMLPTDGNGQIIVFSEPGGYKTSGLVVPTALTYQDALFANDPKLTLYAQTADSRRQMGFNPMKISATDGLDPFRMLSPLLDGHPSVFYALAKTLIPQGPGATENSIYWREKSVNLLTALIHYFLEQNSQNISLEIARFLSQPKREVLRGADQIAASTHESYVQIPMDALHSESDEGYPGLISGVLNKFSFSQFSDVRGFLLEPPDSTKHRLALDPKTDIFLNMPTATMNNFSPMVRLLLASFLTAAQLTEQPERPRVRRLFILDEAKGFGNMDLLETVRDEGRAIGLHLMMIYQTWGQMEKIWGRDSAKAWEDTVDARIMGAISDPDRARSVAAMLGKDTIAIKTETSSTSSAKYQMFTGTVGEGAHEQLKEIPLLSESELAKIPRHGALILTRDLPPILASKAIYFTRADMKDKVKSFSEIAAELEEDRQKVKDAAKTSKPHENESTQNFESNDSRDAGNAPDNNNHRHEQRTRNRQEEMQSSPQSKSTERETFDLFDKSEYETREGPAQKEPSQKPRKI